MDFKFPSQPYLSSSGGAKFLLNSHPTSHPKHSTFQRGYVSGLKRLTIHLLSTYNEILQKQHRTRVHSFKISEAGSLTHNLPLRMSNSWQTNALTREFEPGRTLKHDEYRVLDEISKGGLSLVLRALHIPDQKLVAIKVLKISPQFSKQADKEAKILKYLQCLGQDFGIGSDLVVKLLDEFTHIHQCNLGSRSRDSKTILYRCLVFEHLYSPLSQELRLSHPSGMDLLQVYLVGWQLLAAMWLLSSQQVQIVHANISPQNILLVNPLGGRDSTDQNTTTCSRKFAIKIIDFSQACWISDRQLFQLALTENEPNSLPYKSPEALLALPKTIESDLWSVGCVLFELVTGQPLFGGDSVEQTLAQIIHLRGPLPDKIKLSSKKLYASSKQKPVNWEKVQVEMASMAHINRSPHRVTIASVLRNVKSKSGKNLAASISQIGGSGVLVGGCETSADTELDSLADLIDGLLEVDPQKRTPVAVALKHPFLTKTVIWKQSQFSRRSSMVSNELIMYEEAEFERLMSEQSIPEVEKTQKSSVLNMPLQIPNAVIQANSAKSSKDKPLHKRIGSWSLPRSSNQNSANSSIEGDQLLSHYGNNIAPSVFGSSFEVSESCPSTAKKAGTGGINIQNDFIPTIIEEEENNSPKTTKISVLNQDQFNTHTDSSLLFSELEKLEAQDTQEEELLLLKGELNLTSDAVLNNNSQIPESEEGNLKENQEPLSANITTPLLNTQKLIGDGRHSKKLQNLKLRNQKRRQLIGSQIANSSENLDSVFSVSLFGNQQYNSLPPSMPAYSERVSVFLNNHGMEQKTRPLNNSNSYSSRKYLFGEKENEKERTSQDRSSLDSYQAANSGPFALSKDQTSGKLIRNNNSLIDRYCEGDDLPVRGPSLLGVANTLPNAQNNKSVERISRNLEILTEPRSKPLLLNELPRAVPDFRRLISRNSRSFITALTQHQPLDSSVPISARGSSSQQNFFFKQESDSFGRKSSNKKLRVFQGDDDEPLPEDEASFRNDPNETFNNHFINHGSSVESTLYCPNRPSAFARPDDTTHSRRTSMNFQSNKKRISRVLRGLFHREVTTPELSQSSLGQALLSEGVVIAPIPRRVQNEAIPPKEARESLGSPSFMSEDDLNI